MKYSGRKDRWKRKGKRNVYCQTNLHEHIKNYFCKFLFLYTYFLDKIFLNQSLENRLKIILQFSIQQFLRDSMKLIQKSSNGNAK